MAAASAVLTYIANRIYGLVRWFAHEFLSIAIGLDASSILTSLCRLLGVAVIVAVVRISLSQGLAAGALAATTQCAFVGVLAVSLGNLAKELAIDLSARVLAWFRRDLPRRGVTLDGKTYSETLYSDGTWIRCESSLAGTVCEWTDTSGACNRIVTGPPRKRAP